MDTDVLVDYKYQDGRRLILHLMREQFGVPVAFWSRRSEESIWSLNLGTNALDSKELRDAYRVSYASLDLVPGCSITPSEINLLTRTDPVARDAIAIRDRYPSVEPKQYRQMRLGSTHFEELLIYPRRFPLATRKGPDGVWQVNISGPHDVWLDCDSEEDARTVAAAGVLEEQALDHLRTGPEFAEELRKTANVMERYRMGFGSRRLRGLAKDLESLEVAH
jgi:hypothetical protein